MKITLTNLRSAQGAPTVILLALATALVLACAVTSDSTGKAATAASTSAAVHAIVAAVPAQQQTPSSQQVVSGCSYADFLSFYYAYYYGDRADSRLFFYQRRDWARRCGY